MKVRNISGIVITAGIICLAIILLSGAVPASADGSSTPTLPYAKTWGNSAGRTGCNSTTWGKSDTNTGCSGINNSSKCILLPCKFCRK